MLQIDTQSGAYPLTFVFRGNTYTVVLEPDPDRLEFKAKSVKHANGESVAGELRYHVEVEACRMLFVLLETEADDGPIGNFNLFHRVLVAYYYTVVCYLRDDKKFTADQFNIPILSSAARLISDRTRDMHTAARVGGHAAPRNYFEERTRIALAEVRATYKGKPVFWDNDRWQFFYPSCLACVFDWRNKQISRRIVRLATTIIPEHYRRMIIEAGG